jgi:hypothetical protein
VTQGELQLTEAKTVAEVTHRGRDYQLRRADNGGWQVWRRGDSFLPRRSELSADTGVQPPSEWECVWWPPDQNLRSAATLADLFKRFANGSPVPPEVMHAFAAKVGDAQ